MVWIRNLLIVGLLALTACGGDGNNNSGSSSNANLSSLLVEDGVLNPVFTSNTTSYTADVTGGTTSTRITGFVSESRARLTINGAAVTTGTPSDAIDLIVGNTDVNVVVTAHDGTTKTYRVRIVRPQPSSNADLSNLALSAGSFDQPFDSTTAEYTITVGHLALSTRVLATPSDPFADSIRVDGSPTTIGSPSQIVPLNEGIDATRITVEITAEDDATRKPTPRSHLGRR